MKRSKAVAVLGGVGVAMIVALGGVRAQSPELPEGPGKAVVAENCTACHGPEVVTAQRRTPQDWAEVVNRMVANGAALTDGQYKEVLAYLDATLGKAPGDAASKTTAAHSAAADPKVAPR